MVKAWEASATNASMIDTISTQGRVKKKTYQDGVYRLVGMRRRNDADVPWFSGARTSEMNKQLTDMVQLASSAMMSHEVGKIKMKTTQVAKGRATEDKDCEVHVVCRIALLARLPMGLYTTSCPPRQSIALYRSATAAVDSWL